MITNLNCDANVQFLRTLILMDEAMENALSKWNYNESIDEILEESPWIDEESARFLLISDSLQETFTLGNTFLEQSELIYDKTISTPKVQLQLYLKSPIVSAMKEIIKTGVGVEDKLFMTWRGRFERAHIALRHLINRGYDISEYLNGKKDRVYDTYETQYGSLKEIFKSISDYCNSSPLFVTDVVKNNSGLFKKLFEGNTEVDPAEFETVSEAVMPWDIVMFNRGELNMDNAYMERLTKRLEDPASIYNDVPTITSVAHKIPENRCKDMYKYEFCIDSGIIEFIREDKVTFDKVLDEAEKNMSTSFFL